jgi:hypothetical protein
MTHVFKISCDHNGDVPPIWYNFVMHVGAQTKHMTYHDYKTMLHIKVTEYHGVLDHKQITFADTKSLTQFMLTFS